MPSQVLLKADDVEVQKSGKVSTLFAKKKSVTTNMAVGMNE